jgi:NaMN:DMB phosphoribosyltransferase
LWAAGCDYAAGWPFAWVDDEARDDEANLRDHCQATHLMVHADHRIGLDDRAVAQPLSFAAAS